jgi:hypothetical protein
VPKGGLEPPRVTSHAPQTCASTSSATSARFRKVVKESVGRGLSSSDLGPCRYLLVEACGDAAADGVACGVATGVGVAAGCSGSPDCKTELVPLINGSDKHSANSMKAPAAPIVSFPRMLCVPRGPKAVLETELENKAPASALPGCNKTATTRMMQARINNP